MTQTLELYDGKVFCKYDDATGEILEIYDWHGRDVSDRTARGVMEIVEERMDEEKSK